MSIEIMETKKSSITFDGELYFINVSKSSLFKFYHKIEKSTPEVFDNTLRDWCELKMKKKTQDYGLHYDGLKEMFESVKKFMLDEITGWNEFNTEDEINVITSYTYDQLGITQEEEITEEEN